MKIAILGAGLAGVELGRKLKELKQDFIVLEKESQIGGICRTNKTGEYCWDFAVHAIYSRNKEAMDYFNLLPLDYEYLSRKAKIFHSGNNGRRYILGYPFEMGIKDLPLKDKLECIHGYTAAKMRRKKEYNNLKEWIDTRLGEGIAKHFMFPYNNKIWNCKLSEISDKLVSSKIEPASAIDFILSVLGGKSVGREYQAKFIYPKHGIQTLIDYTAKDFKDNIILNANVEKLVKLGHKWAIITDNGVKEEADMVVSTIPLAELLKKINIEGVKKEYDVLKWNNTFFIMIGLKKGANFQLINDCHWAFFKEDEIFYRITLMHNFSSEFLPVLVAEITQKGVILNKNEEEIRESVVKDLIRLGIIGSRGQIAEVDIKLLNYTYPIPTLGLDDFKDKLANALGEHNIFLLGRNGNWDYINMDGVILNVQKFVTERLFSSRRFNKGMPN